MTTVTLYKIVESELFKQGDNEIVDSDGKLVFFDDNHQLMPKILSYDSDVEQIVKQLFTGMKLENEIYDYHFKKTFFYRFLNRQINRQTIEAFRMELMSTFYQNQSYINRVYSDLEKYITQENRSDSENKGTTLGTSKENSTVDNTELSENINAQTTGNTSKENSTQDTTTEGSGTSKQNNEQDTESTTEGTTTTDNRSATANLPQDSINMNVDSMDMSTADVNDVSRNRQSNDQTSEDKTIGETTGETTNESDTNTVSETTGESDSVQNGTSTGTADRNTTGETEGETSSEQESEAHSVSRVYRLDELFKTSGIMENIFNNFDRKCFLQVW